MKKLITLLTLIGLIMVPVAACMADDGSMDEEMDMLKNKIAKLEQKSVQKATTPVSAADGLMIGGGATFVIQTTHNANGTSYEGEDVTDATYSIDINLEKAVGDNGKVFVDLEAGKGNGLDGEEVVLFSGVNGDTCLTSNNLEVVQVGYSHNFMDGKVNLTAGKLDATKQFDQNAVANNETSQFLACALVNSSSIEFPSDYTLGATLAVDVTDTLEVKAGLLEDDADNEDVFNDNFSFIQLAYAPQISGKQGNYRLYGWYDSSSHVKLDDAMQKNERNYGVGISCDQVITDTITAFTRVGWSRPSISTLKVAWTLGAAVAGSSWNRAADVVGLAVGQNVPSDKYGDAGNPDSKETLVELYYNYKVNDAVSISPDLQVVWNPNGVKEASQGRQDTIVVAGVRAQLNF